MRRSVWLISMILAGVAGTAGCQPSIGETAEDAHSGGAKAASARVRKPRPRSAAAGPNVLLIVLDTVRADHLSGYAYRYRTSPHLNAFARHATLFTRCYAAAPWTLPSHASLFTGKYPFEHGVHRFPHDRPRMPPALFHTRLHRTHLTLAECLAANGYDTAAFIANAGFLDPRFRLNQGFEVYQTQRAPATEINQRFLAWLSRRQDNDRPFFVFLNYMDAHVPYQYTPRVDLPPAPPASESPRLRSSLRQPWVRGDPLPRKRVRYAIGQYDQAIAALDQGLGELFARLDSLALTDDTLIVITADHGEYLGEYDRIDHSGGLHDAVLHVPLIVKRPGSRSRAVDERLVSLVDVPRLILESVPAVPPERAAAQFPYTIGSHPIIAEDYYSLMTVPAHVRRKQTSVAAPRSVDRCLVEGNLKLILPGKAPPKLYALTGGPRERRDLAAGQPAALERMTRTLKDFLESRPAFDKPERVTPATRRQREQLRKLGYFDGYDDTEDNQSDEKPAQP